MKISKTFRLSKEAVDILNKQTNATEYLEALITDSYQRPLEVVPLQQLKELLGAYYNVNTQTSSPTARTRLTLGDVKDTQLSLEREAAEKLEENQDPDDQRIIQKEYQTKINQLWEDYRAQETND